MQKLGVRWFLGHPIDHPFLNWRPRTSRERGWGSSYNFIFTNL
jgi:hypothetical protein